nr:helix-turn-helix domain-containing protein [uncultured Chryseobacterium sp.]
MYNLSNQLKEIGFNIDLLKNVIERNNFLRKFNTLQYFCIYLVLRDFEIWIDGKKFFIKSGHTVFVGPYKTVEFPDIECDDAHVIIFTSLFYEKSKKDSIFLNSEVFFNNSEQPVISPFFGSREYIISLITERLIYFKDADKILYLSAAHGIIESLILDALMHTKAADEKKSDDINFISIGNTFKTLLQKDHREHRSVSHYASKLCITTKKLTRICNHLYGETPKNMIIQKLCNECIIALTNSNLTISEVSFEFGFSCESNFTHFMRKHTGKKPSEIQIFKETDIK